MVFRMVGINNKDFFSDTSNFCCRQLSQRYFKKQVATEIDEYRDTRRHRYTKTQIDDDKDKQMQRKTESVTDGVRDRREQRGI